MNRFPQLKKALFSPFFAEGKYENLKLTWRGGERPHVIYTSASGEQTRDMLEDYDFERLLEKLNERGIVPKPIQQKEPQQS